MGGVGPSFNDDHREVIGFTDLETGLRGLTVLHDPRLGPAVGACRSRPYIEEERALADAFRQARTTTAKALVAGLPVSGGCTVLFSETPVGSRAASPLPAVGRAVESLGGRYRLLPDLQGDLNDMDQAARSTDHVLGRSGGPDLDSVEATALGLRCGIETAVRRKVGRDGLMGASIAIMGLGAVGFRLAEVLREEGAKLTVADRDSRRTERAVRALGISCVAMEEIIHLDVDVLATTAAKDSIDEGMISHLRCQVLAGAIDDPLHSEALGEALHRKGILYAPDTVINAGGLIALVQPLLSPEARAVPLSSQLQAIGSRLDAIIDQALADRLPTMAVVELMVQKALAQRAQPLAQAV